MRALRSAIVWPIIILTTVAFGVPAIFAALLPPRGDWFLRFARGWARTLLALAGVSVRVLHAERLEPGRSFVIVANHESFCDILVLLANLPMQVRFLAKRSVFRVPVLGWSIAAAGFIPVDREDRTRGSETVEAALDQLSGGRSVVVFPEETRTSTGDLLPFKRGAAHLALRSGLPILPIALAGTFQVLKRESLLITPGPVAMSVGNPIEVSGRSPREREAVTRAARDEIRALRAEARRAVA
ncbi:MAG TPA: lysophospholipid acyltransferase family protein [Thermoanaerobaculia bacterium]|jgi:1-acyl-sn-glycerol-3-phosphate acyltransferase